MIIKKLHKVILKEFFPIFIAALVVTLFVFILQFIWLYADDLIGKEVGFSVLLELIYYLMLMNLLMAIPISIMLASIITFGNMGEHFELTAAKASGISLFKIMQPLINFSIGITFFLFIVADNLFPYATFQAWTLISSIRQQHPTMRFQEGLFNYDIQDYVIRIGKKNKKTNMLYNLTIYDHKNYDGNKIVVSADSGKIVVTDDLDYLIIDLFNGSQYEEVNEDNEKSEIKYPYHIDYFKNQRILIPLSNFQFKKADLSFVKQQYNMLTTKHLINKIDSLKLTYNKKKEYFVNVFINNDIFKAGYRPKTSSDSLNYQEKMLVYNNIPAYKLKIPINIDSMIKAQPINYQKSIVLSAKNFAENFNNRTTVYSYELISRREWLAMHQVSLHRKFVYSLACIVFLFIGAPLGSIIRKGGFGLPVIISVVFVMLFYIFITLGEKIAKSGTMSSMHSTWFVIYFFGPIAFYIYYKASKDSVIMHPEILFGNIAKFIKKTFRTISVIKKRKFKK